MSDFGYSPSFGQPQAVDPFVYERLGRLEAENAELRKKVRRYNRGSWALGILLALLTVMRFVAAVAGTAPQ